MQSRTLFYRGYETNRIISLKDLLFAKSLFIRLHVYLQSQKLFYRDWSFDVDKRVAAPLRDFRPPLFPSSFYFPLTNIVIAIANKPVPRTICTELCLNSVSLHFSSAFLLSPWTISHDQRIPYYIHLMNSPKCIYASCETWKDKRVLLDCKGKLKTERYIKRK